MPHDACGPFLGNTTQRDHCHTMSCCGATRWGRRSSARVRNEAAPSPCGRKHSSSARARASSASTSWTKMCSRRRVPPCPRHDNDNGIFPVSQDSQRRRVHARRDAHGAHSPPLTRTPPRRTICCAALYCTWTSSHRAQRRKGCGCAPARCLPDAPRSGRRAILVSYRVHDIV